MAASAIAKLLRDRGEDVERSAGRDDAMDRGVDGRGGQRQLGCSGSERPRAPAASRATVQAVARSPACREAARLVDFKMPQVCRYKRDAYVSK
jgi:hypothetical protein